MALALFDFDGTITTKDSLIDFIQFSVGKRTYYRGVLFLSTVLLAYCIKIIPNHMAKEKLIAHFFKGWGIRQFEKIATQYSLEQIDKIVRPLAIDRLMWHKQQGHKVVIVSASIENWIKPWCDRNDIELIATKLEFKENKFTGKFASKNCYGFEKEHRIRDTYNLSGYETIYAYGDSKGDKEMLGLADKAYYKPFRH